MKRLLSYMNQMRAEALLAPFFKMLEAIFELIVPLLVAGMMDHGIARADRPYLLTRGLFLLLLGLVGFVSAVTAQFFAARVSTQTGTWMRRDLYAHIHSMSWRQIDDLSTSTLITRMTSDINTVQNGINMFLRLFLRSPFVVAGALVMAFAVDPPTASVFAVTIPILALIVFAIILVTMPLYKKVQKQLDDLMGRTREELLGVRVIRAFNRQSSEEEGFHRSADDLFRRQILVGKISGLLNPLTYVVVNLAIVAILLAGGRRVYLGRLSQGAVIALINYMSQILVELVKFANLVILLSRALASNRRINEIFRIDTSHPDGSSPFPRIKEGASCIRFEHVTFSYDSKSLPALEDISFDLPMGGTLGIIGGTGAGKSSLVHLLMRFYQPSSGRIQIGDRPLEDISLSDLRSHIALVPQRAVLFRGSLRDNLLAANPMATDEELLHALDIAQARDFVQAKGLGLDMPIEQEGRNLSGGQRQRLTIARALAAKAPILILDDSASALDFATDSALRRAIRRDSRDRTLILISQRVSTIQSADRILVLDDGRMDGLGSHSALLGTSPSYREICQSQLSPAEISRDMVSV